MMQVRGMLELVLLGARGRAHYIYGDCKSSGR
jgi:hypothetical protein